MSKKIETRFAKLENIEIRESQQGRTIVGHAAVFNTWTDLGRMKEMIRPGAFQGAIEKSDVRALFNHDPNYILGRTSSGTLRVMEDNIGLLIEIDAPNTDLIKDLVVSPMARGDLTQMSFAFTVKERGPKSFDEDGTELREILEIEELFDVSPVTYPAYPTTDVALRSLINHSDSTEIASALIGALRELIPSTGGASEEEEGEAPGRSLSVLKKKLDLIQL